MNSPIHQCLAPIELFETGIGNVVVSRRLSDDYIATGVFLVDVFCLGVENAFLKILSPDEYEYMLEKMEENETLKPVAPDYARKLVEGAEAYAGKLGFSPHPDYRKAKQIFGNINAAACATSSSLGRMANLSLSQGLMIHLPDADISTIPCLKVAAPMVSIIWSRSVALKSFMARMRTKMRIMTRKRTRRIMRRTKIELAVAIHY